jgi:hypothetical protein
VMLEITADSHNLVPFVMFRIKTLQKTNFLRNYCKSSRNRVDYPEANPQMVEQCVKNVAGHFVMQTCHAGFRHLS